MKSIFAGSFNPITNGHLRLIERASQFCSELHVIVGRSGSKSYSLPTEQRLDMVKLALSELTSKNCEFNVYSWDGLITDFAKHHQVFNSIRGIRSAFDFEYEVNMAEVNRKLEPKFETILLNCEPEMKSVSSSAVRELMRFDANYSAFVPKSVLPKLKEFSNAFKKN